MNLKLRFMSRIIDQTHLKTGQKQQVLSKFFKIKTKSIRFKMSNQYNFMFYSTSFMFKQIKQFVQQTTFQRAM